MRKLLWIVALLMLAWGAWWWAATTALQHSAQTWFEQRRDEGWLAQAADATRGGFPARIALGLTDIQIADPVSGLAATLPQIDITTPGYWPGFVTVTVPDAPILLGDPAYQVTLDTTDATAHLDLHPGTSLQLERMAVLSGPWALNAAAEAVLAADDLSAILHQSPSAPDIYTFDLSIEGLRIAASLRDALGVPAHWPQDFENIGISSFVTFDRPWDRSALHTTRPQPVRISMDGAHLQWGDLQLAASAQIEVDAQGRGTGAVTLRADNWPMMLDLAQTAGVIAPDMRLQTELLIRSFANLSGGPDDLDLNLTLKDGQMALGFIPLGPAPLFILP